MKTEFTQPRFTGDRFSEHTLPVDVARDLAAYEALIVDLAKHLWLAEHPDRQRVPKGFTSKFRLDIERIDPGSAKPVIALVASGMLTLSGGENSYFERARDLISECVAAPADQLPQQFPKELLAHFNQFGRSLREDETLELPIPNGRAATLSPDRRKSLVLAAEQVYERDVELTGTIAEADWERSTFRLRLGDGTHTTVPMPENFHATAREFGGRTRDQVCVCGVATYDSWDRIQKVVSVESLEVTQNAAIAARFDELGQLEAGWLDGAGVQLPENELGDVANWMSATYPESLAIPVIVPTPEGNLLIEWDAHGEPSLDIELVTKNGIFHAFGEDESETERIFRLASKQDWNDLYVFLFEHIKPRTT